mmetsp:Transcript_708/g.1854  ORF Transcript_708/g.1854 Transcript_708/m.1854 type:complete len:311 (+) Transcript_708:72-1004(+)
MSVRGALNALTNLVRLITAELQPHVVCAVRVLRAFGAHVRVGVAEVQRDDLVIEEAIPSAVRIIEALHARARALLAHLVHLVGGALPPRRGRTLGVHLVHLPPLAPAHLVIHRAALLVNVRTQRLDARASVHVPTCAQLAGRRLRAARLPCEAMVHFALGRFNRAAAAVGLEEATVCSVLSRVIDGKATESPRGSAREHSTIGGHPVDRATIVPLHHVVCLAIDRLHGDEVARRHEHLRGGGEVDAARALQREGGSAARHSVVRVGIDEVLHIRCAHLPHLDELPPANVLQTPTARVVLRPSDHLVAEDD